MEEEATTQATNKRKEHYTSRKHVVTLFGGLSIGIVCARTHIVNQGNITAIIIWFAISTGITAGLSYYKDKE